MRDAFAFVMFVALAYTVGAPPARAQTETEPARRQIQFSTGASLGNFHFFAHDDNQALHPVGVEYDRPWIRSVLKGNLESVSEVLPVLILSEPARYSAETGALIQAHKNYFGIGFAPAGFRLIWRAPEVLQPYFGVKGGAAWFKTPVPQIGGTHLHFIGEVSVGVQKALSNRWGFRAGFSDFRMTNVGSGTRKVGDFLYFNGGISYRF
jgi:hypothetical protein